MEPDRADISARIAVYPPGADPEITEVAAADPRSATAKFTRSVMGKVSSAARSPRRRSGKWWRTSYTPNTGA
jgi:hypothetical protein